MRIAQVAPLFESVPPRRYGGTERIVSYLTEELVRRGHDVTLFASGDSTTRARLVASCPQALRLSEECNVPDAYHLVMLERLFDDLDHFDVVHFHLGHLHFPLSKRYGQAHVTTLHGRLDLPELGPLFRAYPQMPLVSISDAQRAPLPQLNWQRTVYHGLPEDLYAFHSGPGTYLAFIGRISPEKRIDRAVKIARRTGRPLKIAAKVDPVDRAYFEAEIAPLLEDPLVDFIGEIGEDEKGDFLGNARTLLFPIDWPEPFGLAMIEAMACGTPVVAYRCGSVPEVVHDGVSGFIVENIEDAARAVEQVAMLDRAGCRQAFETRFSVSAMAEQYLEVYRRLIAAQEPSARTDHVPHPQRRMAR